MAAELSVQEGNLGSVLTAAEALLPRKGLHPDPAVPGRVAKATSEEVARFVARDVHGGLAPFDRPFRWRVLRNPVDSRARGCGRFGVAAGYCFASPLSALAADAGRDPLPDIEEPYGLTVVGPRDRQALAHQARVANISALTSKVRTGGVWG